MMTRQLVEDLDYADDIALISSTWKQAQTKLDRLGSNSKSYSAEDKHRQNEGA